jgi:hypothetical protein
MVEAHTPTLSGRATAGGAAGDVAGCAETAVDNASTAMVTMKARDPE